MKRTLQVTASTCKFFEDVVFCFFRAFGSENKAICIVGFA